MTENGIKTYTAWDINTRVFHWVNFICVFSLSLLGLIMLNKGLLGIDEGGVGIKRLHVTFGYLFAVNLIIRIIWGFLGDRTSRWSSLIPGKSFKQELRSYNASLKTDEPHTYIGHNPKGRLAVLLMMLLFVIMMFTGLIRAGTDLYYPPFGQLVASRVAAEGVPVSQIKPYNDTGTDAAKMAELKTFKKPYGLIHIYTAYVLWLLILLHIITVIRTDSKGHGTLISAMFTGKKHLPRKPQDP